MNTFNTLQEVFDFVVTKLMEQGVQSIDGTSCKYRKDGTASCPIRCAVGHLIPDEKYDISIENIPYMELDKSLFNGVFSEKLLEDSFLLDRLLENLQYVHDFSFHILFDEFNRLANDFGLNTKVLKNYE